MRFLDRVYAKLFGMNNLLRKSGMKIGSNCHIYSDLRTPESYLITIGDNVTFSNGIQIITHDNSVCKVSNYTDIFGEVHIGDNCFVGAKSVIMYGVSLPNNTIVAAGSVVIKSPDKEGLIIGGNPAKVIGTVDNLKAKADEYGVNLDGLTPEDKKQAIIKTKKVVK